MQIDRNKVQIRTIWQKGTGTKKTLKIQEGSASNPNPSHALVFHLKWQEELGKMLLIFGLAYPPLPG